MHELALDGKIISRIKKEVTEMVQKSLKEDLIEAKKYSNALADIATEFAMKYFAVVNFVCLPYDEFQEKKAWYAYFQNIAIEGEVLYG